MAQLDLKYCEDYNSTNECKLKYESWEALPSPPSLPITKTRISV